MYTLQRVKSLGGVVYTRPNLTWFSLGCSSSSLSLSTTKLFHQKQKLEPNSYIISNPVEIHSLIVSLYSTLKNEKGLGCAYK